MKRVEQLGRVAPSKTICCFGAGAQLYWAPISIRYGETKQETVFFEKVIQYEKAYAFRFTIPYRMFYGAECNSCWYILNMTWGTRTYVLENNVSCWSLCPRCQSRIRRLSALATYHEPACEAVEIPKSHFFLFFLFMQYIGIDVASEKLDICVHDTKQDDPEKKWRHYKIPNTETDLEKWIVSQNFLKKECLFGTESTGKYHRLCQKILVRRGYSFSLINPIATKQMIAGTIRKKKTDISDAKIITQLLIQGIGDGIKEDQLDTTKKT
jgi:hypothetical protein